MRTFRSMLHFIRADVLERIRRYSFLLVVGINIYAATKFLPHPDANYTMLRFGGTHLGGGYRGVFNSAWVGTVVAWITPLLLSLFGFYLVKGTLDRDHQSRVGAILASTPISNLHYLLGKWLSNLALLSALIGSMILTATGVQILRGEILKVEIWPLVSPFLIIVLPAMALVAALAVFFETLPGLRSGIGNVVYFFLWPILFVMPMVTFSETGSVPKLDPTGGSFLLNEMMLAVQKVNPDYRGGYGGIEVGIPFNTLQTFEWEGITWTSEFIFERLLWMVVSFLLVLITVPLFHRFNPTHLLHPSYRPSMGILERIKGWIWEKLQGVLVPILEVFRARTFGVPRRLVRKLKVKSAFLRALNAELRILIKGQPWWWYLGALGLIYLDLSSPLNDLRKTWFPITWIWPLLVWSNLGVREIRNHTKDLLFSSPHPLLRQLPAVWTSGVLFTALTGIGALISFLSSGTWGCVLAWLLGILFIPSLALAMGIWSGGSKLFEVVYLLLWYIGPIEGVPILDFLGALNDPLQSGMLLPFSLATLLFLAVAFLGRYRQLQC